MADVFGGRFESECQDAAQTLTRESESVNYVADVLTKTRKEYEPYLIMGRATRSARKTKVVTATVVALESYPALIAELKRLREALGENRRIA